MRIRLPDRSQIVRLAGVLLVGPVAGAVAVRQPGMAVAGIAAVVALLLLGYLGDRALPWFVVGVAVFPWYPLTSADAVRPSVPQWLLCAAVVLAAVGPWLWSVAGRPSRTPASRLAPLLGVLFVALHVLVYTNTEGVDAIVTSGTVSVLFAGVILLCARRNARPEMWLAPCFGGLLVLLGLGLLGLAMAPGTRVAAGTGYPITYGALIIGLLPGALFYASRRSTALVLFTAAAAAGLLVASQSRSAWVGAAVMLLVTLLLLARQGNVRTVGVASLGVALLVGLILTIGPLHSVVSERLSSRNANSLSVTHRTWSADYAFEQIKLRPFFGIGQPGYAGQQAASLTGVGAIDNGYLSIAVDLGLLGLLMMLVPLGVALRVLCRAFVRRHASGAEIALALSIIGLSAVTLFYDGFYWAQIILILFGLAGVLSTVSGRVFAPAPAGAPRHRPRGRALLRPET